MKELERLKERLKANVAEMRVHREQADQIYSRVVVDIRRASTYGVSLRQLAAITGLSYQRIQQIVHGENLDPKHLRARAAKHRRPKSGPPRASVKG